MFQYPYMVNLHLSCGKAHLWELSRQNHHNPFILSGLQSDLPPSLFTKVPTLFYLRVNLANRPTLQQSLRSAQEKSESTHPKYSAESYEFFFLPTTVDLELTLGMEAQRASHRIV